MSIKSGTIEKLGNGFLSYVWNKRFVTISESEETLSYFLDDKDSKPKGVIQLKGAFIGNINPMLLKNYCIMIQPSPPKGSPIYFAFENYQIATDWRSFLLKANSNVNQNQTKVRKEETKTNQVNKVQSISSTQIGEKGIPSREKSEQFDKILDSERTYNGPLITLNNIPQEIQDAYVKAQEIIIDKRSEWISYRICNGIRTTVKKDEKEIKRVDHRALILHLILSFLLYIVSRIIIALLSLPYPLIFFEMLTFTYFRWDSFIKSNSYFTTFCACCTLPISPIEVAEILSDPTLYHRFDMNCEKIQMSNTNSNDHKYYYETFSIENSYFWKKISKKCNLKLELYSTKDENESYFFHIANCENYKLDNNQSNHVEITEYKESFLVIPCSSDKESIIYLFSTIKFGKQIPGYIADIIKFERTYLLQILRDYSRFDFYQKKQCKSKKNIEENNLLASPLLITSNLKDSLYLTNKSSNIKINRLFKRMNKSSIYTFEEFVPIESRYKKYYKYNKGGIICKNVEELDQQTGITLDILKHASKQIISSKHLIQMSLPVKLFEAKSTLERITYLWSTGTKFLPLASNQDDPIERMKYVICFVISGLHGIIDQNKPFHPLLGETYQGYWPDGTEIYLEHSNISPETTHYFIDASAFKMYGYFEYDFQLVDLVNSLVGKQNGSNTILFTDGSKITYNLPEIKITGICLGKRVINFYGAALFHYSKKNITATIHFGKENTSTENNSECDILKGFIAQNNQIVSEISGYWTQGLSFNKIIYWDLASTELIKPLSDYPCLPSDWSFREDLIALSKGNIVESQKLKANLEKQQEIEMKNRKRERKYYDLSSK